MSASIVNSLRTTATVFRRLPRITGNPTSCCFFKISDRKSSQWQRKSSLPQQNNLLLPTSYNFCSKPQKNAEVNKASSNDAKSPENVESLDLEDEKKLGLFARFKVMYKKYWYVLLPVHVVTSIGWLGGFYYLSKSGVDIPSLLQTLHISESIIDKLKDSDMGHLAIAYLCYKIATPARYMVTLGGTTVSIKYLVQAGYIKPVPTKTELIRMYEEKKADRAKKKQEKADRLDNK